MTQLEGSGEPCLANLSVADAAALRGVEGERAGIRTLCDGADRPGRISAREQRESQRPPVLICADAVADGGTPESEGQRRLAIADDRVDGANGPAAVGVQCRESERAVETGIIGDRGLARRAKGKR